MTPIEQRIKRLVEDYRAQCLWFLRPDYMPTTTDEILNVLSLIQRYGDRAGYLRAAEIRSWLSQRSRQPS
jgi:hypothetical protein